MKYPRLLFAICLSLLSAFAFVITPFQPAFADQGNATSSNPQLLNVSSPSASDTLVGTPGGAYRYYQVSYQGGNAPVLFTLTYTPYWGTGNTTFGFNLYGPNSTSYAGRVTGTSGASATAQYTLVNGAAMTILVQVYNYSAGGSVNYNLTVSGLSGGSTTAAVGTNAVSPGQAIPVSATNASLGGTMVGSASGTFNYYTLQYPGGNASMSVTMNYNPPYSGTAQGVGFKLYRPVPTGSLYVATSSLASEDTNSASVSATINAASAAPYELEVYNYWPGVSISYGITVAGLAGPAPAAVGNFTSDHAIVLNSARPGATGTIVGNRGGTFNNYLVTYPGSDSFFSISVTYSGTITSTPALWGFKIYEGSTLEATVPATNDGNGVFSAVWGYADTGGPLTFGVQVFNYDPSTPANYVIYENGAQ